MTLAHKEGAVELAGRLPVPDNGASQSLANLSGNKLQIDQIEAETGNAMTGFFLALPIGLMFWAMIIGAAYLIY